VAGAALIVGAIAGALGWIPAVQPLVSGSSAGNAATFTVAGATLLLADFTALLAWFTWESIGATRREAKIAEDALAAAKRQAETADKSLKAVEQQAKIAERQVEATNRQAQVAQDQLTASWRPLLVEPRLATDPFEIRPILEKEFDFQVQFVNIGRGPAFVRKAFLNLVAAGALSKAILPGIVEPGGGVRLTFTLSPTDGVDRALTTALTQGNTNLTVTVLYHDLGRGAAWRSRASLIKVGTYQWVTAKVDISPIEMTFLD